jgi:radical SAM protein with 4Fe4S-binding SPASM domain
MGSFALTVQKIALLRRHGILVNVMFTLFKENADDLVPLLEYVAAKTEATSFSFDLGCSIGGAAENALEDLSPREVAELLDAYDRCSRIVACPGFRIHEKSNLHRLRKYIQGEYLPAIPDSCTRIAGCLAGWTGLCLLSNGAALACRRLPIIVGKMPEQSFEELFLSSEIMKKFRRHEYFGTCGQCQLYSVCRGCPAAAFGATGDAFAECPHCFKPQNQRRREVHKRLIASPPLATSPEEESVFIKQNRTYLDNYDGYLRRRAFQDAFFPLVHTANAVKEFLECPDSYLDDRSLSLDGDEIAWLAFYVSEGGVSIRYDQRSLKRTSRFRRHESVKPTLAIEPDRIAIELKDRTISMDAGARTIVEKLFSHDSFTAADVLQWDGDFDWPEVKAFLHVMLEELIICYADK